MADDKLRGCGRQGRGWVNRARETRPPPSGDGSHGETDNHYVMVNSGHLGGQDDAGRILCDLVAAAAKAVDVWSTYVMALGTRHKKSLEPL